MKTSVLLFATLTAAAAFAVPVAENVTFYQDNVNTVTITYTLTETPAIVTLDISPGTMLSLPMDAHTSPVTFV